MNKLLLLGIAATLGAARLAFFPANPPVELQPTSPGTAQTGHLNISGTATVGQLRSSNTVFGQSTAPTGISYGGFFTAASNQARGFYGYASSPTGLTYGGFFQNASSQGRAVYGLATGTTADNYGGYFQSAGSSGRGVLGVAASATGTTYGVYGTAVSPSGYGVYSNGKLGVTGDASFLSKVLVGSAAVPGNSLIEATGTSGSYDHPIADISNGGPGSTVVVSNKGLRSNALGPGTSVGMEGVAASSNGQNAFGVYGLATSSAYSFGVYGWALSGSPAYGGYFEGAIYASSANSAIKAFMIDHPLDPDHKILTHSSVESDERKNIYDGVVVTDSRGYATVTTPNWFEALNEDFKYQLTVIDSQDADTFTLAKVVQEVKNGKFRIRTSTPNAKVCWQITGRRHDPVSAHYPLEVERMKVGGEIGKYYEPEAYGKDTSLGVGYVPIETETSSGRPKPAKRK